MDKNKLNLTDVASIGDDGKPEAKYTRIGEKIRQTIPGPMQCSMACGGRNCKWENPARWSDADQVIKGVYSSWVLDNVVAMSRPSTGVIKKYDMIGQFKRHNINSIINLQRPGEHASCGPPLDKESLFTYNPKTFMDSNIFFYNFGWKDFGVTSLNTILDMVKVMCFALEEGSVAVHCHAGLGRTGVLIACYLVFAHRLDPGAAILRVRKSRSNSIQTRGQIACVHEFCQFLRPLRIVFPQVVPNSKRLSLKQFLNRQHHLLHGFESRELRYTPKLVHVVCNRLTDMVKSESAYVLGKFHSETDNEKQVKRCNTVADIKETVPGAFVNEEKEEERADQSSSPTDVEAVLSPRVVRRGSARSRNVSECSNRPSSAGEKYVHVAENVDLNYGDSFGEVDYSLQDLNSGLVSDSLVLVKGHTPLNSYVDEDDQINQNDSEITFVKPQNRAPYQSAVIPAIEQNSTKSEDSEANLDSSSDSGLQFTAKTFHQNDENEDLQQLDVTSSSITLSENSNVNNNSEVVATAIEETTLVSPGISPWESSNSEAVRSLVASHTAGIQTTILVESPPHSAKLRKMRFSPGMSETILPTGSRAKSSKGSKSNTVIPGLTKDNVDEQQTDEADNIAEVDEAHEEVFAKSTDDEASVDVEPSEQPDKDGSVPKRKKMLLLSELTAHEQNVLINNDVLPTSNEQSNNNNMYKMPLTISDPALNDTFDKSQQVSTDLNVLGATNASHLDIINNPKQQGEEDLEVINIDETGGPSFSDDESEDENTQELLSSMASRVSWTQQMATGKDESDRNDAEVSAQRGLSAASKSSGRQTPLMYRAERNLEMVEEREKRGSNASEREEGAVAASTGSNVDSNSSDGRGTPSPTNCLDVSNTKGIDGTSGNVAADAPSDTAGSFLTTTPVVHVARSSKSMNDIASVLLHPDHQDSCPSRRSSYGDVSRVGSAERHAQDKLGIAKAFSYKLTDDEYLWEKIYTQQVAINSHNGAWGELSCVNDPYVLSSLMWSWLEHLETPVLPLDNVQQIMEIYEREISSSSSSPITGGRASSVVRSFEKAIDSLERAQCCTLKCILECAHSFPPIPSDCSASVIRRTVIALTHSSTSGDVASDEDEGDQSPASCNRKLADAMQAYIQERYALSLGESASRTPLPEDKLLKPTEVSTDSCEDKSSPQETKDVLPSKPVSQTDDPTSTSPTSPSSSPSSNERKSRRSVGSARSSSSSGSGSAGNLGNMMQPSIVVS